MKAVKDFVFFMPSCQDITFSITVSACLLNSSVPICYDDLKHDPVYFISNTFSLDFSSIYK